MIPVFLNFLIEKKKEKDWNKHTFTSLKYQESYKKIIKVAAKNYVKVVRIGSVFQSIFYCIQLRGLRITSPELAWIRENAK